MFTFFDLHFIYLLYTCTIKNNLPMKQRRQKKLECEVFENVLFSKISLMKIGKAKLSEIFPLLNIIAHQNKIDLSVGKMDRSICIAIVKPSDFSRCRVILENSVMFN